MMGRLNQYQRQLFYLFCLEDIVPVDHRVREIAALLDLSWVHAELAPHYSPLGCPSIDPVLMIRTPIVSYVFAIRSERLLCREVKVNLAYRWFCGLLRLRYLFRHRPSAGPIACSSYDCSNIGQVYKYLRRAFDDSTAELEFQNLLQGNLSERNLGAGSRVD
jgi:hypothetical protein